MKSNTNPLIPDTYYHVLNRGINSESIFRTVSDYNLFLQKYIAFINPVADTFVYCLMQNHYHFLIKTKKETELRKLDFNNDPSKIIGQQFATLFSSYSYLFNRNLNRTGGLFEIPFQRKLITSDEQLTNTILYIHLNPLKHGVCMDFENYPYSSYQNILFDNKTFLKRDEVVKWFGGKKEYQICHSEVARRH